ncbi:MAG: hypothetical protein LJU34_09840 [Oscillospiraceae bacterium]|nr:hypothetical protein [Oscillospiraceae bacterium]
MARGKIICRHLLMVFCGLVRVLYALFALTAAINAYPRYLLIGLDILFFASFIMADAAR